MKQFCFVFFFSEDGNRQHRIGFLRRRETHAVSATIVLAVCLEMLLELWHRRQSPEEDSGLFAQEAKSRV